MRYYKIKITKDGKLIQPSSLKDAGVDDATFTSFVNNQNIPGALNVEMDFPITTFDSPWFASHLAVWGLSLKEIAQSFDLNNCDIQVEAGFKKGLPLATSAAKYAGIILQGTIFSAYGNWIGTSQKIDMVLMPPIGTKASPINIQFSAEPNKPIANAVEQALKAAFKDKGYDVKVAISDELVFSYPQSGGYSSLPAFSKALLQMTTAKQFAGIKTKSGSKYEGAKITIRGKTVIVFDGTQDYGNFTADNPAKIAFQDIIGQPTWIDPATMNFKTVMRADLSVGDFIQMPEKLGAPYVVLAPGAAIPGVPAENIRNKIHFQGKYLISGVHHFGNFRQPDAASWVTTYDCVISNPPS